MTAPGCLAQTDPESTIVKIFAINLPHARAFQVRSKNKSNGNSSITGTCGTVLGALTVEELIVQEKSLFPTRAILSNGKSISPLSSEPRVLERIKGIPHKYHILVSL